MTQLQAERFRLVTRSDFDGLVCAALLKHLGMLDDLRAVEAPEELREDWSRFLDGIQEAFDKFPELADATRDGDREKLEELTSDFTRIASDTRPFAERNDLQDCLPEQQT